MPHLAPTQKKLSRRSGTSLAPTSGGVLQRNKRESQIDHSVEIPPIVHEVLNSPGHQLDSATRAFMEPRFGHDFSHVRVHTDSKAADSARAVNALAYTVGGDVVFAEGRYQPNAEKGRRLLAHELTHTIQQRSFASGLSLNQANSIGAPETSFERTAEDWSARLSPGRAAITPIQRITLQRQPMPSAEIEMPAEYAFAGDKTKRTDKRYARTLASQDAARIRKKGTLTTEDRGEVKAKLQFFEGEAWDIYSQLIRPALLDVTREEIEMPPQAARPGAAPAPAMKYPDWDAAVGKFMNNPAYIDNNIKMVSFFTAELAQIHYHDGTMLELGLVPKWMRPPFEEVDYHTQKSKIRPFVNPASGDVSFFLEQELANVPRTMPFGEMQKHFLHPVGFVVVSGGHIVPTRVNMLTAPTLCGVLLDQERQFVETTTMVAEMGEKVAGIIGAYAGAGGGWAKGPGTPARALVSRAESKVAALEANLSTEAKTLAREMDSLMAKGGSKTLIVKEVRLMDVAVSKQGDVLQVKRFMSKLPEELRGKGTGLEVTRAFEDAATHLGRVNGAKTVTIDVGLIANPGWGKLLEARGYIYVETEGHWIKTIKL